MGNKITTERAKIRKSNRKSGLVYRKRDDKKKGKSVDVEEEIVTNTNTNDAESWKQLYDIFKKDRMKLPQFLLQHGSFDSLQNLFEHIDKNKPDHPINQLLLGNIGTESNKQKAIYELPTFELLNTIKMVCKLLSINKVEEICAGMGLLSRMLAEKTDLEVEATDGLRWIDTCSVQKYYDVQRKFILEYILDHESYNDRLLIISWVPDNGVDDFIKLVERKRPKQILFIGNIRLSAPIVKIMEEQNGYNVIHLPVKQMCYSEPINIDVLPKNCYRSVSTLCVYDNMTISKKQIKVTTGPQNFNKLTKKMSDKMVIYNLVLLNLFPRWVTNYIYDIGDTGKKLFDNLTICLCERISIPKYVKNDEDFDFWFNKKIMRHYPILITDYSKFKEYKELILLLEGENGLEILHEIGVVPLYINSINIAEQFIWLDYSTADKSWKQSKDSFLVEFSLRFRV